MKKAFYSLKNLRYDVVGTLVAALSLYIAYKLEPEQSLFISLLFIFIGLAIIIHWRLKEKDFYFIPFTKRRDKDDWIGRGIFEYSKTHNCFRITNASPGYVYSKCLLWSDYKFEFEFKIVKTCLGAIVRAVNLSNYVMLQITPKGIRPHVRVNSGWSVWEPQSVGLDLGRNQLSLDKWYKIIISCEKNSIYIKIFEKDKKIFDRKWEIAPGHIIFQFKSDEKNAKPTNIPFPINLEYGSFGFRNFGNEEALIKNVLVEKI